MSKLPDWAEPPGKDWHHRDNYSDTDVVWYHGPTNAVIYQHGPGNYTEPGEPVAGAITPVPAKHRRPWWRRPFAAGVAGGCLVQLVALAVQHWR